jgi:hypothetical protein
MTKISDDALQGGATARALGPEDALIAWLLGLPDGVDPARAAAVALGAAPGREREWETPAGSRLRALLQEIAETPAGALSTPSGRRGRLRC